MIDIGTVDVDVGPIEELVSRAHQSNRGLPVPHGIGPFGIGVITGIDGQTTGDVEEAAVGDGVLVVVSIIEGIDLPSQATSARLIVPAHGLGVEDGLGQGEPLGPIGRRIGEAILRRRHGGHTPEGLIIITLG